MKNEALTLFSDVYPKHRGQSLIANVVRPVIAATLAIAVCPAWSQSHSQQFGPYTLRSSTAGTEDLSASTARQHGIERSPRHAVLNVTVLKKEAGIDKTVPAEVHAVARNLSGHRREIDMRTITAEGRISYMGTYQFVHGEVLDFTVTARPENGTSAMTMTYRDRLWARGDLPDQPPKRP